MLSEKVLALNRSWIPVSIVSVKRAICLLYSNVAKAVDIENYNAHDFETWINIGPKNRLIITPKLKIPVPDVIVLLIYNQVAYRRTAFSKRSIYKRDKFTCQYCGATPPISGLSIDHIVPKSRGGSTTRWDNCVVACKKCNRAKGNHLISEVSMSLTKIPIEPMAQKLIDSKIDHPIWSKFINGK